MIPVLLAAAPVVRLPANTLSRIPTAVFTTTSTAFLLAVSVSSRASTAAALSTVAAGAAAAVTVSITPVASLISCTCATKRP